MKIFSFVKADIVLEAQNREEFDEQVAHYAENCVFKSDRQAVIFYNGRTILIHLNEVVDPEPDERIAKVDVTTEIKT